MDISVALCTYNGEEFLGQQLVSIAAQTLLPKELVVYDDRSSDHTAQIVEAFARRAPFEVRLIVNEKNIGSNLNFARAINACKGDVIALCDQDDAWHADKLEELARVLEEKPAVGLVFSDATLADESLKPLGITLWQCLQLNAAKQASLRSEAAFTTLLGGNLITGATSAFRAQYKQIAAAVPPGIPIGHDGWIGLVIAAVAELELVGKPLIDYRQHQAQQVGAPYAGLQRDRATMRSAKDRKAFYEAHLRLLRDLKGTLLEANRRWSSKRLEKAVEEVQARERHLAIRVALPPSRLHRLPVVFHELVNGSYSRYSNGLRSAAIDLLA